METGKIVFGVNKETGKLVLDQMESPLYAEIDALKRENNELLLAVAHEAHMMGRIYTKLGEPEKPSEVCAMIEKMVEQKIIYHNKE